jgi:site-specific recombinase XerD
MSVSLMPTKRMESLNKSEDVVRFLSHLAENEELAPTSQTQAFNALLYFFRYVLNQPEVDFRGAIRAKKRLRIPVVLSIDEVTRALDRLPANFRLMGRLQYGTGVRINELIRLRVKDLDFARGQVVVCKGRVKGFASRDLMVETA